MKPNRLLSASALLFVMAAPSVVQTLHRASPSAAEPRATVATAALHGLGVYFEPNAGQTDAEARFVARAGAQRLFFTRTGVVTSVEQPAQPSARADRRHRRGPPQRGAVSVVRTSFVGANADPRVCGEDLLPGRSNYFLGDDPSLWRRGVEHFGRVRYEHLYPGIDAVFHGAGRRIEYDFVLAPGADAGAIELAFEGAESVALDPSGDLVLRVPGGELRHRRPVVWQERDGTRVAVAADFVLDGTDHAQVRVGEYDRASALVIDPQVDYVTYLGGSAGDGNDDGLSVAVDSAGNAYVCGFTRSTNFPATSGAFQTAPGSDQNDSFVVKVDPTGANLIYATYIGGNASDNAWAIAVDSSGNAYVGGETSSSNFPRLNSIKTAPQSTDAFVLKLDPDGSDLGYSTIFGGTGQEEGFSLAIDSTGHAYMQGATNSDPLPVTANAAQSAYGGGSHDAFVAKLETDGSAFLYLTYLGGNGDDGASASGIAVDADGNAYVTGATDSTNFPHVPQASALQPARAAFEDAYIAKLNATGTALVYSTYYGGNETDWGIAIAVDSSRSAYVVSLTESSDLVTASAFQSTYHGGGDLCVTKLNAAGTALVYSTYLGGTADEVPGGIAVDSSGNAWVDGVTGSSTDFPLLNATQPTFGGGGDDWFVTKIDATGSALCFSTFLGGSGGETLFDYGTPLALDAAGGAVWVTGTTSSSGFATNGAADTTLGGQSDGFLAKLSVETDCGEPAPPAIQSYFLPKRIVATRNAKHLEKSSLIAAGFIDTGPAPADLTQAATLLVGGLSFGPTSLVKAGKNFKFVAPGLSFVIFPNPSGSSRARFRLKTKGDLTGKVDLGGPLTMRFTQGAIDGIGEVKLGSGRYTIGRIRGALVAPNLYLVSSNATLKGAGKDSFALKVGLATDGVTPGNASDVTVRLGGSFSSKIVASQFVRRGDKYVFKSKTSGISSIVVDYLRETITVAAKKTSLGTFATGGQAVLVSVSLGADRRDVLLRMVKKGKSLRY